MKLLLLNGPNLNLLGLREPAVYGTTSFDTVLDQLRQEFPQLTIEYYQSNVEGELINKLHACGFTHDGIIFNAGAYTHTSVALGDAVAAIQTPVIEVHLSNTMAREDFRHVSYIAPKCFGSIAGFGADSYRLAIEAFLRRSAQ